MRADRSRRLAALEARPAPPQPSAADLAFLAYLDEAVETYASQVSPALQEALAKAGSTQAAAIAICDFWEAVEKIAPEVAEQLNRLLYAEQPTP
ncbi:hypothetical protein VDG07_12750 [Xanthomonas campestris pv. raphani]|uniref:hypothetical protein n=1 Tax=Xanthomonas campestris TaxID=339 RepID=UPI002B22E123|nr:hypothetical protein [Xanthomonas campestris]MEA9796201.1 hypothetical protein [Xanthomonas campestris pv. raphani]